MNLVNYITFIPAILVAITFHEYAHGKTAALLGDPTPGSQGRLTLNPLAHLDFLGTLMLLTVHFGWAKPVQVNPVYFRGDRRKGLLLVSLSGPLMNLVLAYLAAFAWRLTPSSSPCWRLSLPSFSGLMWLWHFNNPVPPLMDRKSSPTSYPGVQPCSSINWNLTDHSFSYYYWSPVWWAKSSPGYRFYVGGYYYSCRYLNEQINERKGLIQ